MIRWLSRSVVFTVAAMASVPALAVQAAHPIDAMHYFVGHWECAGRFPASGRRIASRIDFETGLDGRALIKRHADMAPASYRAMEAWAYSPRAGQFQATVLDNGGGTRLMTSDGWHDRTLTWSVTDPAQPKQAFVYVRQDGNHFRLDWKIAPPGKRSMVVGDTLTCRRSGAAG